MIKKFELIFHSESFISNVAIPVPDESNWPFVRLKMPGAD